VVPRPRALRSVDLVLAAIVALSAALRFALLLPAWAGTLDDLAIPDDAYLTLTIARAIGRGWGPLYGLARTNGFQPLFALLLAPLDALGLRDPDAFLRAGLVVLVIADTLALALLVTIASRIARDRAVPRVVALAWAASPVGILIALNGMETALAVLLQLAVFERLTAWTRPAVTAALSPARAATLGLLLGLAALARIDSLLLLPALLLALAPALLRKRPAGRRWLTAAACGALGMAVPLLPWMVASWRWTHDLVPVSGLATRELMLDAVNHHPTAALYAHTLRWGVSTVLRGNAVPLAAGAAFALLLLADPGPRRAWRRLAPWRCAIAPAAWFGLALFAGYVGFAFGTWHFARYLFPLAVPIALAFAGLLDTALAGLRWRRGRAIALGACVVAIALGAALQPAGRRLLDRKPTYTWGYRAIGLWARDHFAPGTVIGGSQTGALGYYAERLTVVNLDGVVNRDALDAMRSGRCMEYVRSCWIRWLVWQDDVAMIARHSRGARASDLTPLGTIPGIRSCGDDWRLYRVNP
jgi:hypothetical protein